MKIGILDCLLGARGESGYYLATELGFDCLEISIDHFEDMSLDGGMLYDFYSSRKTAQSAQIDISSVHASFLLRENWFHTSEGTHKSTEISLKSTIQQMIENQINILVLPLYGASYPTNDQHLIALEKQLRHLCDEIKDEQIQIALKTSLDADYLTTLLMRIDHPCLKICFDPGNLIPLQRDIEKEFELMADWIAHIHLKDRHANGDITGLGQGELKVNELMNLLSDRSYEGAIILETPTDADAVKSARKNLEYLKYESAA